MQIHACSFVLASEIFKDCGSFKQLMDNCGRMTWGGANRTLFDTPTMRREVELASEEIDGDDWKLRHEYCLVRERVYTLPEGVYVDMEN